RKFRRQSIRHLKRPTLPGNLPDQTFLLNWNHWNDGMRIRVTACFQAQSTSFDQPNTYAPAKEARCASRDSLEYRLLVRRRTADYAQDLARGGLLIERFAEVFVARLELLKEAHVLDGDHGLVGEGLEQCKVRIGKRARI